MQTLRRSVSQRVTGRSVSPGVHIAQRSMAVMRPREDDDFDEDYDLDLETLASFYPSAHRKQVHALTSYPFSLS